jgi:hypothetical protein
MMTPISETAHIDIVPYRLALTKLEDDCYVLGHTVNTPSASGCQMPK